VIRGQRPSSSHADNVQRLTLAPYEQGRDQGWLSSFVVSSAIITRGVLEGFHCALPGQNDAHSLKKIILASVNFFFELVVKH
jgi:hypothetical protein